MSLQVFELCRTFAENRGNTGWNEGGKEIVESLGGEIASSIRTASEQYGAWSGDVDLTHLEFTTKGNELTVVAHTTVPSYTTTYRMQLDNPLDIPHAQVNVARS